MKKSSIARRVPRKIGGEDEDEVSVQNPEVALAAQDAVIKRPKIKARTSSSLRTSFGSRGGEDENDSDASGVVTPKRGSLSRVAIQRNASKRSSLLAVNLPLRNSDESDDARPSYDADALRELKESTPSKPRDLTVTDFATESNRHGTTALDLSSKFGNSLARFGTSSGIPTDIEIAEKKARRARLAKEQQAEEYISLDPDDPNMDNVDDDENTMLDERGRLVLKPKDKYNQSESRLVRDDENVMEGFDDFTEDGRMALGKTAEVEAIQKRRREMAAQIAEAEGNDDSDSGDSHTSERERNVAFEASQTRHGAYAATANSADPYASQRTRTPPKINPLPTLDSAIERLRTRVAEMQTFRNQKLQEMQAIQREKLRIAEDEVRIQRSLKETAEKYKQLRAEKGIIVAESNDEVASANLPGLIAAPPVAADATAAPDASSSSYIPLDDANGATQTSPGDLVPAGGNAAPAGAQVDNNEGQTTVEEDDRRSDQGSDSKGPRVDTMFPPTDQTGFGRQGGGLGLGMSSRPEDEDEDDYY